MKHTPTPWVVIDEACITSIDEDTAQEHADNFVIWIAECHHGHVGYHETNSANAAHIVKCVNAHDELLRTIDELAAIVERLDETGNYQEDLFNVGKLLKNLEQSK